MVATLPNTVIKWISDVLALDEINVAQLKRHGTHALKVTELKTLSYKIDNELSHYCRNNNTSDTLQQEDRLVFAFGGERFHRPPSNAKKDAWIRYVQTCFYKDNLKSILVSKDDIIWKALGLEPPPECSCSSSQVPDTNTLDGRKSMYPSTRRVRSGSLSTSNGSVLPQVLDVDQTTSSFNSHHQGRGGNNYDQGMSHYRCDYGNFGTNNDSTPSCLEEETGRRGDLMNIKRKRPYLDEQSRTRTTLSYENESENDRRKRLQGTTGEEENNKKNQNVVGRSVSYPPPQIQTSTRNITRDDVRTKGGENPISFDKTGFEGITLPSVSGNLFPNDDSLLGQNIPPESAGGLHLDRIVAAQNHLVGGDANLDDSNIINFLSSSSSLNRDRRNSLQQGVDIGGLLHSEILFGGGETHNQLDLLQSGGGHSTHLQHLLVDNQRKREKRLQYDLLLNQISSSPGHALSLPERLQRPLSGGVTQEELLASTQQEGSNNQVAILSSLLNRSDQYSATRTPLPSLSSSRLLGSSSSLLDQERGEALLLELQRLRQEQELLLSRSSGNGDSAFIVGELLPSLLGTRSFLAETAGTSFHHERTSTFQDSMTRQGMDSLPFLNSATRQGPLLGGDSLCTSAALIAANDPSSNSINASSNILAANKMIPANNSTSSQVPPQLLQLHQAEANRLRQEEEFLRRRLMIMAGTKTSASSTLPGVSNNLSSSVYDYNKQSALGGLGASAATMASLERNHALLNKILNNAHVRQQISSENFSQETKSAIESSDPGCVSFLPIEAQEDLELVNNSRDKSIGGRFASAKTRPEPSSRNISTTNRNFFPISNDDNSMKRQNSPGNTSSQIRRKTKITRSDEESNSSNSTTAGNRKESSKSAFSTSPVNKSTAVLSPSHSNLHPFLSSASYSKLQTLSRFRPVAVRNNDNLATTTPPPSITTTSTHNLQSEQEGDERIN